MKNIKYIFNILIYICITLTFTACSLHNSDNKTKTTVVKITRNNKKSSNKIVQKEETITATYKLPDENKKDLSTNIKKLSKLGYTIQVGAFKDVDNAARMADKLENQNLDPYYYKDSTGLYKVRFGNFNNRDTAEKKAQYFVNRKVITEYFIIPPDAHTVSRSSQKGAVGSQYFLRNEVVKSAKNYIGVPYKWGGNSVAGIDCSGLTQAVYRLNGLDIPRNSRQQFNMGKKIAKTDLKHGDLVFFATNGGKNVNHVGVYIGNDQFIHAPSKGKNVKIETLSNPFFSKTYMGARSYL